MSFKRGYKHTQPVLTRFSYFGVASRSEFYFAAGGNSKIEKPDRLKHQEERNHYSLFMVLIYSLNSTIHFKTLWPFVCLSNKFIAAYRNISIYKDVLRFIFSLCGN